MDQASWQVLCSTAPSGRVERRAAKGGHSSNPVCTGVKPDPEAGRTVPNQDVWGFSEVGYTVQDMAPELDKVILDGEGKMNVLINQTRASTGHFQALCNKT